jgi:hypothetical protein
VTLTAGRGVSTIRWDEAPGVAAYDVTWVATDLNGDAILDTNAVPIAGSKTNISGTEFRHTPLPLSPCPTIGPVCPTYTYVVTPSGAPAAPAPTVAAVSADLRAIAPSVTNTDSVTLAGIKSGGSRVEIRNSADTLVANIDHRETGWTASIPLTSDGLATFRLVAVEGDRSSLETIYQVTQDTDAPSGSALTIDNVSCETTPSSTKRVTLSGAKEPGLAVFRVREPDAPDQQIVGATPGASWSGVIEVESSATQINVVEKDTAGNASPQVSRTLPACS